MSLGPVRKAAVLLVPWGFMCIFATLYISLLVPRLREGQLAVLCVGGFAVLVFACFFAAALTFSRDVLVDRWPEHTGE